MNDSLETNRMAWDLRTGIHVGSEFYNIAAFRAGALTLHRPELALMGDVRGLRLLHLQCHFGLDTLSWGRLGAIPTGVDFSGIAIDLARGLSREVEVPATFVQADVQMMGERFKWSFDLAVATYGVLCWLGNLGGWADGIRGSLRKGGRFILVEFHPILDILFNGKVSGQARYFGPACPQRRATKGTYTDPDAPISYEEYRWQHPISEVITALIRAGLRVTDFTEYPFCSYRLFPGLDEQRDGVWFPSVEAGKVPFMYSITAEAS